MTIKSPSFVSGGTHCAAEVLQRAICECVSPERGETVMLMFRAVLLQIAATFIVAAIAGLLAGWHGAVSAMLGGLAIALPNSLFALRLFVESRKLGGASAAAFFVGEFMKVAATIALLAAAASLYRDLHWLALIAGLVVALKANLLALLSKKF